MSVPPAEQPPRGLKLSDEEEDRFRRWCDYRPVELAGMLIELERKLEQRRRVARGPRPSKLVVETLHGCFTACLGVVGAFQLGNSLTTGTVKSVQRWLDAWVAIYREAA